MSSSSSKHDPVGSVIPTTRTQLLTVKDVIDTVRLSPSVGVVPEGANAKTIAGHRDHLLLHRVDPAYRNAALHDWAAKRERGIQSPGSASLQIIIPASALIALMSCNGLPHRGVKR